LGVLLYELLTGATPFDKDRLHSASYDEMRRIIREEEPPRPSARLHSLFDSLPLAGRPENSSGSLPLEGRAGEGVGATETAALATTIAERRRTDPRHLVQSIRGELDWIVMKCLEKERNRRYETPNSLARDIERYLHDEPVQACPPSAAYRLRKFARRNKALLAGGGAIAAALVVGLGLATWQYYRATTESARAKAVSGLVQEILASSNPDKTKGSGYTVREALDEFAAGLGDQLAGEPEVEADIRSVIGKSYWQLEVYDRAEVHSKKALDLRRELFGDSDERVADSLVDYAWNLAGQGRKAEAERHVRDALSIYQEQNSDPHRTVRALWTLQHFLTRQFRHPEAEEVANKALALAGDGRDSDYAELPKILRGLAEAKSTAGKYDEAENFAQRAVDIHRRVHGDHHPETAWGLLALGQALRAQKKFAEAEKPLRESLAIFRKYYTSEHSSIQDVGRELESVLRGKDDRPGLDALAIDLLKPSDTPDDNVRLTELLLASRKPTDAQTQEARRRIRQAIDGFGRVATDYPDDLDRRRRALDGYTTAIKPCIEASGFEGEVDELNRRLEAELPKFLADFPDSGDCQWWTAVVYRNWGSQLFVYGKHLPTAERAFSEAKEIFEKLSISDPKRYGIWLMVADINLWLGEAKWRLDKLEDAGESFRRGMDIFDQHAVEIAAVPTDEIHLTSVWDSFYIAYFLILTDREDEAAELVRKAVDNAKLITDPAWSAQALLGLALIQPRLGDAAGYRATCKALLDVDFAAASDLTKVQTIWAWLVAPDALEDMSLVVTRAEEFAKHNSLGYPHGDLLLWGAAHYRAGHFERAAELLQESIDVYPSDPPPIPGAAHINHHRLFLAMNRWRQGRRNEARQLLAEAQRGIDEELKPPSLPFEFRIPTEVLRREAEALIEPKEADEAVENDRTNDE
jgi:tetratricopeptide (TPR) repeat protein